MSFSIQTNVNALTAQENLRVNSQFQARTIQRLTSGYRINSSSDDAAGLAVANQFHSSTMELTQGVRNANDGISQLQIMDGGLNNISQILGRLKTLATQSASDTFTGDRSTLQTEYSGLLAEINRQADNVGLGANNAANAKQIGVYIGGGQDANTNSSVNVNLTGSKVDSASLGLSQTSIITAGAVQISTQLATAVKAGEAATFQLYTETGQHTIAINGKSGDTLQSQLGDLNTQLQSLGISASLNGTGNLQFQSANAFSVTGIASGAAANLVNNAAETANNTGLNWQKIAITATTAYSLQIKIGGTTATASIPSQAAADSNDVDAINSALKASGITSVRAVLDQTVAAGTGIILEGSTSFTTADDHAAPGGAMVAIGAGSTAPAGSAVGNPQVAIDALTAAFKSLGTTQGKIGAGENSLNYAINLAQSQISNFSAAESQIRDADIAQEAANLTKAQVLQQASMAAMAQANSAPQAVLKLLQ